MSREEVMEDLHWLHNKCLVICGRVAAREASESAISLWGRPQWLGTHWKIKVGMCESSERSLQHPEVVYSGRPLVLTQESHAGQRVTAKVDTGRLARLGVKMKPS